MTSPAKAYPRTPEPGNPARTEAWALLEAARQLHQTKDGPIEDFRNRSDGDSLVNDWNTKFFCGFFCYRF